MTNKKQEFENKVATLKRVFYRRCLFCEEVIESHYFPPRTNQTILSTCEFCFAKYEVLKEGKELTTISKVFPDICYFCQEPSRRERKAVISTYPGVPLFTDIVEEKIGGISHCAPCAARYKLLIELEEEQEEVNSLQAQIEVPIRRV